MAEEFPHLSVGIYPFYGQLAEQGAQTVVVIEGRMAEAVEQGKSALLSRIPPSIVLFQADGGCIKLQDAPDDSQPAVE